MLDELLEFAAAIALGTCNLRASAPGASAPQHCGDSADLLFKTGEWTIQRVAGGANGLVYRARAVGGAGGPGGDFAIKFSAPDLPGQPRRRARRRQAQEPPAPGRRCAAATRIC